MPHAPRPMSRPFGDLQSECKGRVSRSVVGSYVLGESGRRARLCDSRGSTYRSPDHEARPRRAGPPSKCPVAQVEVFYYERAPRTAAVLADKMVVRPNGWLTTL